MLSARAALLQALRRGPGYGHDLVRRVQGASLGRITLAPASVYPTLRALRAARLVRSWSVVPGRARGGRARTYYELTERGIRAAEADRSALSRLLGSGGAFSRPTSAAEAVRMRERIELGAELSEAAGLLRVRAKRRARRCRSAAG